MNNCTKLFFSMSLIFCLTSKIDASEKKYAPNLADLHEDYHGKTYKESSDDDVWNIAPEHIILTDILCNIEDTRDAAYLNIHERKKAAENANRIEQLKKLKSQK